MHNDLCGAITPHLFHLLFDLRQEPLQQGARVIACAVRQSFLHRVTSREQALLAGSLEEQQWNCPGEGSRLWDCMAPVIALWVDAVRNT